MTPVIRRAGSHALLIDLPDLTTVMDWHAELSHSPLAGQVDAVAAAQTVLLNFASAADATRAVSHLRDLSPGAASDVTPENIVIDTLYNGEDLAELAEMLGMSTEALIEWHTSTTWTAAFGGFAPGFTYCVSENPLDVPRRKSPRTSVPAGSVALAGNFSAVYPRESPGGWQLIGVTEQKMWRSDEQPPALVRPGDTVTYRAVRELAGDVTPPAAKRPAAAHRPVLEVTNSGLQTLVQDLGRPGYGDLGVTESGAADQSAARAANEALGNEPGAAVLENIGGLSLTALVDTVVAVTGAQAPVTVGRRVFQLGAPVLLPAGSELTVGAATLGARSYVAVRGGVIAFSELESSATDLLSGLGPDPIRTGDRIATAPAASSIVGAVTNPVRVSELDGHTHAELRVVAGPRDDWFTEGVQALVDTQWTVTEASNRVGLRLSGPEIERGRHEELASEGIVAGSIQVPANGQPVMFHRDHAVTGGYPVIATVVADDLDIAGQLPPGATVNFRLIEL